MANDTPFVGEPADSQEVIMRATYRALVTHGYAGLSIQRIADEADLSKSTFYHHYDDKDDLLVSFSEFAIEEFMRIFSLESGDDPAENLKTFVDLLVAESADFERELPEEADAVLGTYVELRAQGIRDENIREKFSETDEAFAAQIEGIVRAGVDDGVFAPVDPEATAEFISTIIAGDTFRRLTSDEHDSHAVRAALHEYIDEYLLS